VHVVLFVLTFLTTTMAGALHVGVDPFANPSALSAGLPFSVTLLLILLCHEFGHYGAALRHGVPTTLPYFIPGPPFLVGTFGAFIRMQGLPRSRRALFDIGAAGPWGGLLVAVPAVVLGLSWSEVRPLEPSFDSGGLSLGNSLLFTSLSELVLGIHPDAATILLHPVALAGWFGIFVTFLNLLPVGQLDGGHVVYALLGRGHRTIARLFFLVVIGMGFLGWEGWFVWALMLAFVLRVDHPDTVDSDTPLDPFRKLAAWATVVVFFLTFMPVPISVIEPPTRARPPQLHRQVPPERWLEPDAPDGRDDGTLMNIRRQLTSLPSVDPPVRG
jgi:membrane-associated protease RseP (regulator of RpoE activity)